MVNLDWKNLSFCYIDTDYNVRSYFKDGKWGAVELTDKKTIDLHMAASSLHYGQESFEGLKAYRGKDGRIRLFRWQENAKRMNNSARGIMMPEIPESLYKEAIYKVVKENAKFVPPYGTGATLYIRPLLIGSNAVLGVKPAQEYLFLIFVNPVGPYFKDGFKPSDYMICRDHDRAAYFGTGNIKVGGNYAASLRSLDKAKQLGFTSVIYLDSREKKYIDESGQTNFFGINGNKYITPKSPSVLPSITNMSLQVLAKDEGMEVECRPIKVEELGTFSEAGGCGTAAVISPIRKIIDPENNKTYEYCKDNKPGPVCEKLYNRLTAIQFGDEPDKFGWIEFVD